MAEAIATRFERIGTVSHEAVRRLLKQRGIHYRRAKEWLTSPDPLYAVHKSQRDRLLVLARTAPDGAAVCLDESWFGRRHCRYRAWAAKTDPPRAAKRWDKTAAALKSRSVL